MSYDLYLTIDTGGPEPARVTERRNITSNLAGLWCHAGCDLAEAHGKTAAEVLPQLTAAIEQMQADSDTYRAMNPPNGWENYEGCLEFLQELHTDWVAHPKATIDVWH